MRRIGYILTAAIALTAAGAYITLAPARADSAATPVFDIYQMPAGYRDWKVVSVAHEAGNLNDLGQIDGHGDKDEAGECRGRTGLHGE